MSGELHSDKKTRREVLQGVMALSANGFVSAKMAAQEVAGPMKAKMPEQTKVAGLEAGRSVAGPQLTPFRPGTKVLRVDAGGRRDGRKSIWRRQLGNPRATQWIFERKARVPGRARSVSLGRRRISASRGARAGSRRRKVERRFGGRWFGSESRRIRVRMRALVG